MWMQGGVTEDDRLDAGEARQVAAPHGADAAALARAGSLVAVVMIVLWTGTRARRARSSSATASTTASPTGDAGALNLAVAGYVVVAVLAYFTYRHADHR